MIEVNIKTSDGQHELARITIEKQPSDKKEYGDYSLRFAVDTGEGFATYQRSAYNFPREKYNVLGLIKLALETLEEKELTLDAKPDARRSSSVARRLPRVM